MSSFFKTSYKIARKKDYHSTNEGKDFDLLTNLYKKFGQSDFCLAVSNLFRSRDPFIVGRGYDVVALNTKIHGLLVISKQEKGSLRVKEALEKDRQELDKYHKHKAAGK